MSPSKAAPCRFCTTLPFSLISCCVAVLACQAVLRVVDDDHITFRIAAVTGADEDLAFRVSGEESRGYLAEMTALCHEEGEGRREKKAECRRQKAEGRRQNGECRMQNGECRMQNGECRMVNAEW